MRFPEEFGEYTAILMRKLLISTTLTASLMTGCSSINIDSDTWSLFGDVIPRSLDNLPFIYRPEIIQGNSIDQERVDKLQPGMDKRQVRFVMGTPLIQDIFHDDRWDYYYGRGIGEIEFERRVTLFFENDRLTRITGDYQPQPPLAGEGATKDHETIITVPDWEPLDKSLIEKALETVGMDDEAAPARTATGDTEAGTIEPAAGEPAQ